METDRRFLRLPKKTGIAWYTRARPEKIGEKNIDSPRQSKLFNTRVEIVSTLAAPTMKGFILAKDILSRGQHLKSRRNKK